MNEVPDVVRLCRLEHVAKAKKKKGAIVGTTKETMKTLVPRSSGETGDEEDSGEEAGWKREILFGRKRKKSKGGSGQEGEGTGEDDGPGSAPPNEEQDGSQAAPDKQGMNATPSLEAMPPHDSQTAANHFAEPEAALAEGSDHRAPEEASDVADPSLNGNGSKQLNGDTRRSSSPPGEVEAHTRTDT